MTGPDTQTREKKKKINQNLFSHKYSKISNSSDFEVMRRLASVAPYYTCYLSFPDTQNRWESI
jgi:hypothetical protein